MGSTESRDHFGFRHLLPRSLVLLALHLASSSAVMSAPQHTRGFARQPTPPVARLIERAEYSEAEATARALLASTEQESGKASLATARAIDQLVEALAYNGRGAEEATLELAQRSLAVKERTAAKQPLELAASLFNLGQVLDLAGKYGPARDALLRAGEVYRQELGPDDSSFGRVLVSLGEVLRKQDEKSEARSLQLEALRILEERLGSEHLDTIDALIGLANVTADLGVAATVPLFRRALKVREGALGSEHPKVGEALHDLAYQLFWEGVYDEARHLSERALRIFESTLRRDHPMLGHHLTDLAQLAGAMGDVEGASTLYERALQIQSRSLGASHPRLVATMMDHGSFLHQAGRYAEARAQGESLLAVLRRTESPPMLVAETLMSLSDQAADLGDFSRAERLWAEAVDVRDHDFPDGARGPWKFIEMEYNDLLRISGRLEEAERAEAEAVAAYENDPSRPDLARHLRKHGDVLMRLGAFDRAEDAYRQALGIHHEISPGDHPELARIMIGLARTTAHDDDVGAAGELAEQAFQIASLNYAPNHPLVTTTLRDLSIYRAKAGDPGGAWDAALEAEALAREHFLTTAQSMAEREALRFSSTRVSGLDIILSLVGTEGASRRRQTLDALIRSRTLVLDEMAARHVAITDPVLAPLHRRLTAARDRLAFLTIRGLASESPTDYQRRILLAGDEKDRLERELAASSHAFQLRHARTRAGLGEVERALPRASALVSFVRFRSQTLGKPAPGGAVDTGIPTYLAFVLRSGDRSPEVIRLGTAAEIERRVAAVRELLSRAAMAPTRAGRRGEREYRSKAGDLRAVVWDPLRVALEDSDLVFLVPDGALNLVNFGALPSRSLGYLEESEPRIHYLASERDLIVDTGGLSGTGLLALGDPDFDNTALFAALSPSADRIADGRLPESATEPDAPFRSRSTSCEDFSSMRFERLPASRSELAEIANTWWRWLKSNDSRFESGRLSEGTAGKVLSLSGRAATEAAFKRQAGSQRVVHIATHGFFLDKCDSITRKRHSSEESTVAPSILENPLLLSGFALAGANHHTAAVGSEEDGILTAEEIAALDLSGVEWAVLSACESGLGQITTGEGVLGLRRAFQVAGARTVIMSLWPVEDEATRQWMRALYEHRLLDGMSTADAVRQASLDLLHARRAAGESTHPFFWAGFVAAGDWR